jgi:hypothetical protein
VAFATLTEAVEHGEGGFGPAAGRRATTTLKRLLIVVLLAGVALAIGFAVGFGVIAVANWIIPFQPEDDDSLEEFVLVGLALLATAVTAALVFVLGVRALGDRRAAGDE